MQAMVDRPNSVPRPLTPMKRPRSLQSSSHTESDASEAAPGEAHELRQQLEQAQALLSHFQLAVCWTMWRCAAVLQQHDTQDAKPGKSLYV